MAREYDEHRQVQIMQAAEENNPSLVPDMTDDEKEDYDGYVDFFNSLRKRNGGTLKGLDIDLPYD